MAGFFSFQKIQVCWQPLKSINRSDDLNFKFCQTFSIAGNMEGGKPLVVDPSVQQFEYVTHSQSFGNVSTPNIQSKTVIASSGVQSQPQKVIVVSSLEDLKRLQSGGFNTAIRAPVASQSDSHINYASGSGLPEGTATNVDTEGSSGEPANDLVIPQTSEAVAQEEDVPEVDIAVNNVVSSFSVRCHLNLRRVALEGINVIYKRENNVSKSFF